MPEQPPTPPGADLADEAPPAIAAARPESNAFLTGLKEHRLYRVALGYAVGAWVVLQVAAIVLPGFGAPAWVLRALMIVLALGFGAALLAGRSLLPRATAGRVGWLVTALLPAAAVTGFFLLRPLPRPAESVAPTQAATAAPAAPVLSEKSVAVLPFENLSDDKANGYYAWTGEKAAAVETLTALLRVPATLSYGELRLHPEFDALRGDPGFEALVASQAPQPTP